MLLFDGLISFWIYIMRQIGRIERRLKLNDMRILLSVVESGGMGKAAERLGTSQPAISRAIADLERTLGVRLLDRSRRGIEPTNYGHALINRCVAVFDEIQQGVRDIEFLADPTAGELRVGASIAVAAGFIVAAVDRLTRDHPRLNINVFATDTGAAYRALHERKIDIAIVHMVEKIPMGELDAEILFEEPQVVAAASGNRWTRHRNVELEELMNEPWTLAPLDTQFGNLAVDAFRANGLGLPKMLITSSLPVRQSLVATGRFLTIVPRIVLQFPPGSASLKRLPINLPTTQRPVGIVTMRNRMLSSVAQLFRERVREMARSLGRRGRA
jgi:DNA-binding transcriptional LysR family regulator